jgi:hypothetical protein
MQTEDYTIQYNPETKTVVIRGYLRLEGIEAYEPIRRFLLETAQAEDTCTVDLQELEFLNSSGISMLSMFVVAMRDQNHTHLTFRGSNKVLWQTRSLKNLKRLMPKLEIDLVD